MTEKEKMMRGILYNANYDEELLKEREEAQELCFLYNGLSPKEKDKRDEILGKLFGKMGKNTTVLSPFYCDYGYNIEVGDNFFSNYNLTILDGGKVKMGDNVFIAPNCCLTTATHPFDVEERNQGFEYAYAITIGNNVWLGANVTILPNVKIGDNSVIGAGSVVTRDIPANVVAVGNPCRVIRNLKK